MPMAPSSFPCSRSVNTTLMTLPAWTHRMTAPPTTSQGPSRSRCPRPGLIHPGEGGFDEALAAWDLQQNPDRAPVVSTASGREEAMSLVHAIATSPDHEATSALEALDDPDASGEALRHVLVGWGPLPRGLRGRRCGGGRRRPAARPRDDKDHRRGVDRVGLTLGAAWQEWGVRGVPQRPRCMTWRPSPARPTR